MNATSLHQFRDVSASWPEVESEPVFRGANLTATGQHNRRVILQAARAEGEITCARLAELTGLTTTAMFKITKDLVADGLMTCARGSQKVLGKPGHVFRLNPAAASALGLYVGRDQITLAAADFAGRVVHRFQRSARLSTPDDVRVFVAEGIKCLARHDGELMSRTTGFGVAIADGPGTMAFVDLPDTLGEWLGTELPDFLRRLGDIQISRESDAAAAAIGEMLIGAGLNLNSFFYLFVGAGLGAGLVINKQLVRGAHGRSGNIGHLPQINPLRSSRTDLSKTLSNAVSTEDLLGALHREGYVDASPADLDQLDARGQAIVDQWTEAVADYFYLPLLNVLYVVDPDAVLIGGSLPPSLVERLCYQMRKRLSMHVGVQWPQAGVRPAGVLADPAAVGAAVMAFQDIWDLPKGRAVRRLHELRD
jgi:predicted NBD/HSP70 family sugar kinase